MAEWLSRPLLIDHSSSSYQIPNLDLDGSDAGPISPFSIVYYEYSLIHRLAEKNPRLNSAEARAKPHVILRDIDMWISTLPASLQVTNPVTCWDEQHPYIRMQRAALHTFIWLSKIALLKPLLVHPEHYTLDQGGTALRVVATDACIQTIHSATETVECSKLTNLKFHFATFALFDTATILSSALMHEVRDSPVVQARMRQAVAQAHRTLSQVAPSTVAANNSVRLLERLMSALPTSVIAVNPSTEGSGVTSGSLKVASTLDLELPSSQGLVVSEHFMDISDELSTWLEEQDGVQTNDLSGVIRLRDYDLDGIDQIWDWESLGLGIV
jgi:hypothetical protein